MVILRSFLNYPNEGALIGRMLAGYADLEIDLMNCVQVVRGDLDTVLKAMFRSRGETQRIDVADAFGRQHYRNLGIGTQFEMAIGTVRYCLKIRNQYAHCNWHDDNSGQLCFVNLEEIANENTLITDLIALTRRYVNVVHLESQLEYFQYAENLLVWVVQEGNRLAGRPHIPGSILPAALAQPALSLP